MQRFAVKLCGLCCCKFRAECDAEVDSNSVLTRLGCSVIGRWMCSSFSKKLFLLAVPAGNFIREQGFPLSISSYPCTR